MQSQKRQNDLCSFPRQTILLRSCISLHPHKQYKRIYFSPCLLILFVCKFFYDGYSEWCEVISHCSFDLHVSYSNDVEHFFITPNAQPTVHTSAEVSDDIWVPSLAS